MKALQIVYVNSVALALVLSAGCGDSVGEPYTPPVPKITSVTPEVANTQGGDNLTIHGTDLHPYAKVKIGGIVTQTKWISDTQLQVLVPTNPGLRKATIVVTNPDQQSTSRDDVFSYYSGTFDFEQRNSFNIGIDDPRALVVGDIDGDGLQDIIYASNGALLAKSSSVGVVLGSGGQGSQPVDFTPTPDGIALVDLTGDKKLDLVLANPRFNEILVLPGEGNGTFRAAKHSVLEVAPPYLALKGLTLADLDGDQKLDIIVSCNGINSIAAARGNGDGTFGPDVTIFPAGPETSMVVASDVDGNGKIDVLANPSTQDGIDLFLNKTDFHSDFRNYVSLPIGDGTILYPKRISVGDMNGDQHPDLLVLDGGTTLNAHRLQTSVILSHGDGTFDSPTILSVEPTFGLPFGMEVADLNGDRKLDIVILTDYSLMIFPGHGDGTFDQPHSVTSWAFGNDTRSLRIADMDGDDKLDLVISTSRVTSNSAVPGSIEIIYNTSI